jgi:hypothetical protein
MDVLSLDTQDEAFYFMNLCEKNKNILDSQNLIGGVTTQGKSRDKWYWVNSGDRVNYPLKFWSTEPDFANNNEWCLAVSTNYKGGWAFNDISCNDYRHKFFCQKLEDISTFRRNPRTFLFKQITQNNKRIKQKFVISNTNKLLFGNSLKFLHKIQG